MLLLQKNATVTYCHSRTTDLPAYLKTADIVIAAVGVPELIQGKDLKPGCVVLDVGINRREDGSLCGDVHFESASQVAAAITPVPGGVGPMTIVCLMKNTVALYEAQG
jgi:methylenetetrahydrofolate dehydrogenase (NADP+)/methenyltetrahydrofolate cyclohydrolase